MKCKYSEQDSALYVEGDLIESSARDFEAHLMECEGCLRLVDELRESQSLFKSLRQETASGAALTQVRSRVLAEVTGVNSKTAWGRKVERLLWLGLRRGYALAGVGLVILLGIGLWYGSRIPKDSVEIDPLPPMADVPLTRGTIDNPVLQVGEKVAKAIVPLPEGDSVRGKQRTQGVVRAVIPKQEVPEPDPAATPAEPKQLVVKLLTDDPNIVIYWLVDQNGG